MSLPKGGVVAITMVIDWPLQPQGAGQLASLLIVSSEILEDIEKRKKTS